LLNLTGDQIDRWVSIEGAEHMDRALEQGKGVILITAHYGNWELFARKLALCGYTLSVIARDSDDPGMTGIANRIRENAGYKVLSRDGSALPAIRRLKKNETLGILPDQNTFSGIPLDFFGRVALTATGPAVFSLKSGAPIICGFAHREPDGSFLVRISPPLEVALTGNEEEDIYRVTSAYTLAIEDQIRKDPTQWLWLHDRWGHAERTMRVTRTTEMESVQ
jgi:Kdo2-lipid IVA lauroyltransferase/acyltransferase